MSVSGISSSSFLDFNIQSGQSRIQQFRQEFQQLGQDLQAGNVAASQKDFATLQQYAPQPASTAAAPVARAFSQLSQDLQAGNVSAAQQDYTTIQQDFQTQAAQGDHHHHGSVSDEGGPGQILAQLGQALQSGDLTSAQQSYTALQQELQQYAQNGGSLVPSLTNSVSISA